jgi:hypothetical protein
LVPEAWGAGAGRLHLEFGHDAGAVEFVLDVEER